MQTFQILAIFGLASLGFAAPLAEAEAEAEAQILSGLLNPIIKGSTVTCKSGNVYCTNGSKTKCEKKTVGQTCQSGSVICCDSAAGLLNLQLLPICGNQVAISIPVNILSGNS